LNRSEASAEFTFLLLLNTLRRLNVAVSEVSALRWRLREDLLRGLELRTKQLGLVGFGRIGHRMARYSEAFDTQIAQSDPYVSTQRWPAWSLEEFFERFDAVCVCRRLTLETTGLIDQHFLSRLKTDACLINTSRGEAIVEQDLIGILRVRQETRDGMDVLVGEVTRSHNTSPLLELHDRG